MASETQIGQLVIDLKIKTEALEKGLETAKKKLEQIESQNKQVENCNKSLDASFIVMSASIVASFVKIKSAIDDGVQKYKEYESANKGLESIVKGQGLSFSNAQSFIEDYISDGLIPLSDATMAYKNLASRGYNEEQIKQTMIALKDAAAFGRQSTYEYGEAIATATEGLKNENSVLVDNAGVTKNVAKMWQDYAKSVGKTTESLTQAEKIEAEVKGIREESKNQIGDAAKYTETYAGQQAQVNAVNIELSKTIGESMIPVLTQYSSLQLSITKSLTKFISNHKTATSATITFTTALLATIITVTSVKKAINAYTTATGVANKATKALTASVMSNPLFIGGLILSTVIAGYSAYCTKAQETAEAQEKLNKVTEKYNQIKEGTYKYTENSANDLEIERQNIEKQLQYKEKELQLKEREKELAGIVNQSIFDEGFDIKKVIEADKELRNVQNELRNVQNEYNNNVKESENYGNSIDELNDKLKINAKGIEDANTIKNISNAFDIDTIKNQQKEAAQLKVSANELQGYLNTIKKSNKESAEYQNAVQAVAKAYPEASSAGGILTDVLEGIIQAQQLQADEAWNASQTSIQGHIENIQAAINDENIQKQVAANMGIAWDENFGNKLRTILALLQTIGNYSPTEVPNITPTVTTRKSGGSSSYSNKRLDNYKKEIAHRKALDQLSLQQEIAMYETALRSYAKTTDEKRELREKIYELNKELANKEKEMLEQQTEDYETYIQQQKNLRGSAYDVTEQTRDYNKIIQMHKNYLNQIMKDERLSLDERKQIYREELQTIRDYEQQKRDLRVEQIDNTVSQLTNAITKQLEEMQEKDKEFIDKQIEEIEKLKEIRINAINAEYDAKIEAIEKELEALDKAEQQKSRDEEDAEHEKKRKRLEDLIAFEHDATTKANYQKELDKLLAEYQKTLDNRALEDKKEALNAQKDLLQEEQDSKIQAVEDEVEKQKEVYDKQLTDLEEYYNKQIDMAQQTAESMLLNVETNQDKILNLLKSYGNAYEITGQSLGEKLAQGINEGLASKIENIIARIQNSIDAGIEAQIAKIASSVYKYEAGSNKPQTTNVNVTQNNYIEQNPEMPSETYRKLNNVSQKLAEEFAGM